MLTLLRELLKLGLSAAYRWVRFSSCLHTYDGQNHVEKVLDATSACWQLKILRIKPSAPQRWVYSDVWSTHVVFRRSNQIICIPHPVQSLFCLVFFFFLNTQIQEQCFKEIIQATKAIKQWGLFFLVPHICMKMQGTPSWWAIGGHFCCNLRYAVDIYSEQAAFRWSFHTIDDTLLFAHGAAQMLHTCPFTLPHAHPFRALCSQKNLCRQLIPAWDSVMEVSNMQQRLCLKGSCSAY